MSDKTDIDYAFELYDRITKTYTPADIDACASLFTTCKVRVSGGKGQTPYAFELYDRIAQTCCLEDIEACIDLFTTCMIRVRVSEGKGQARKQVDKSPSMN